MRYNIFTATYNDGEWEHPNIFDGEATSLHTRGNQIAWVAYCITGVVQICMVEHCTIDHIEDDGTIWLVKSKKGVK